MFTVLIVDDDPDVCEVVGRQLTKEGYQTHSVNNGKSLMSALSERQVDLVILDVMLGDENGFDLAVELRKTMDIPIIMLTGRGDEVDRVVGLELGADDYVTKPFSPRELAARVKTVLRRSSRPIRSPIPSSDENIIAKFGTWRMDMVSRELFGKADEAVELTSGEFNLLEALVSHPRRVLSREQLLDYAGRDNVIDRSIDVQILRLRRKIEPDPQNPEIIKTVRGTGYVFSAKITWSSA